MFASSPVKRSMAADKPLWMAGLASPFRIAAITFAVCLTCDAAIASCQSLEEFASLSKAEQREFLAAAFRDRLSRTDNVRCEFSIRLFNAEVNELSYEYDPNLQDRANKGYTRTYEQRRIGESYLSKTISHGKNGQPSEVEVINLYDHDTGINKGYVLTPTSRFTAHGRISEERDIVDLSNRFSFWFRGESNNFGVSLFPELISSLPRAEIRIDHVRNLIILHYQRPDEGWIGVTISRTVEIDPSRSFLPICSRMHKTEENSKEVLWVEAFDVLATREIDGIDLPMRIREIQSNGPEKPGHAAAVYDIAVKQFGMGSLEPSTLSLSFPADTRVVDAIKGTAYTVGADGVIASEVQPLAGFEPAGIGRELIGSMAPEFGEGRWLNSPPLSQDDIVGQGAEIAFVGVGCAPCQRTLSRFAESSEPAGKIKILVFLSDDTEAGIAAKLEPFGITCPVFIPAESDADPRGMVFTAYRVEGLPTTVLISPSGKCESHQLGR